MIIEVHIHGRLIFARMKRYYVRYCEQEEATSIYTTPHQSLNKLCVIDVSGCSEVDTSEQQRSIVELCARKVENLTFYRFIFIIKNVHCYSKSYE